MPPRDRRGIFDEDAESYDRARPVYPADLVTDLGRLGGIVPGARVVEIGPGTGQATAALPAPGAPTPPHRRGQAVLLLHRP